MTDTVAALALALLDFHERETSFRIRGNRMLAIAPATWISILAGGASAQRRAIETEKSVMPAHVYKAGLVSALVHDHEISAPIARGTVDAAAQLDKLYARAGALQVRDADAFGQAARPEPERHAGLRSLYATKFPVIAFVSAGAEGTRARKGHGNLRLPGQTHAVDVDVRERRASSRRDSERSPQ